MKITRTTGLLASLALGASLFAAGTASADGNAALKPTKDQKKAVVKAWSTWDGGPAYKGPLKCIDVGLAANNENVAGLRFNENASGCKAYAFDGTAMLYGHHKKKWFVLTEGSSISQAQCKAVALLVGAPVWTDLSSYATGLGCENIT